MSSLPFVFMGTKPAKAEVRTQSTTGAGFGVEKPSSKGPSGPAPARKSSLSIVDVLKKTNPNLFPTRAINIRTVPTPARQPQIAHSTSPSSESHVPLSTSPLSSSPIFPPEASAARPSRLALGPPYLSRTLGPAPRRRMLSGTDTDSDHGPSSRAAVPLFSQLSRTATEARRPTFSSVPAGSFPVKFQAPSAFVAPQSLAAREAPRSALGRPHAFEEDDGDLSDDEADDDDMDDDGEDTLGLEKDARHAPNDAPTRFRGAGHIDSPPASARSLAGPGLPPPFSSPYSSDMSHSPPAAPRSLSSPKDGGLRAHEARLRTMGVVRSCGPTPEEFAKLCAQHPYFKGAFERFRSKVSPSGALRLERRDLDDPSRWKALGLFLTSCENIWSLRLEGVPLTREDAERFSALVLTHIRDITFYDNELGLHEGALDVVVSMLLLCEYLESAAFERQSLKEQHVPQLVELLSKRQTIKTLRLCWNGIRDDGAMQLANTIRRIRSSLTRLDLSHNLIGPRASKKLFLAQESLRREGREVQIDTTRSPLQRTKNRPNRPMKTSSAQSTIPPEPQRYPQRVIPKESSRSPFSVRALLRLPGDAVRNARIRFPPPRFAGRD